jgi:hypothetical protein
MRSACGRRRATSGSQRVSSHESKGPTAAPASSTNRTPAIWPSSARAATSPPWRRRRRGRRGSRRGPRAPSRRGPARRGRRVPRCSGWARWRCRAGAPRGRRAPPWWRPCRRRRPAAGRRSRVGPLPHRPGPARRARGRSAGGLERAAASERSYRADHAVERPPAAGEQRQRARQGRQAGAGGPDDAAGRGSGRRWGRAAAALVGAEAGEQVERGPRAPARRARRSRLDVADRDRGDVDAAAVGGVGDGAARSSSGRG